MAVLHFSAALTPALVGAATTAEQTFTAGPGNLGTDAVVTVTKPTAQAGIAAVHARVVSATQIGVTFANCTAGGITPTAAELYQFAVAD